MLKSLGIDDDKKELAKPKAAAPARLKKQFKPTRTYPIRSREDAIVDSFCVSDDEESDAEESDRDESDRENEGNENESYVDSDSESGDSEESDEQGGPYGPVEQAAAANLQLEKTREEEQAATHQALQPRGRGPPEW